LAVDPHEGLPAFRKPNPVLPNQADTNERLNLGIQVADAHSGAVDVIKFIAILFAHTVPARRVGAPVSPDPAGASRSTWSSPEL